MKPLIVMPDAVAVIADYLRSELGGVPVMSRVPNPRPRRFVQVSRVGGTARTVVSDAPMLDIHAWDETDADAADLIAMCRALIAALRGVTGGVTVYGSAEVGGPQWLPDPDSSQPRYALAVQVHMRGRVLER
ncbi:hypothetical protein OH723_24210 [Streptomyces albidoflavus]|uniref:hypothetical protein n=1 Tax=Streptomyces albidoflavus TaxID=1886 RepID=UPI0038678256|nr:hypothetical protein OH723_24210 [Streptomyces albidoflavus]